MYGVGAFGVTQPAYFTTYDGYKSLLRAPNKNVAKGDHSKREQIDIRISTSLVPPPPSLCRPFLPSYCRGNHCTVGRDSRGEAKKLWDRIISLNISCRLPSLPPALLGVGGPRRRRQPSRSSSPFPFSHGRNTRGENARQDLLAKSGYTCILHREGGRAGAGAGGRGACGRPEG